MDNLDKLRAYVKNQLNLGNSPDAIKNSLKSSGYSDEQINAVFSPQPTPPPSQPKSLNKKKLVVTGVVVLLGLSVTGALGFFYKDQLFPKAQTSKTTDSDATNEVVSCDQYYDIGYLRGVKENTSGDQSAEDRVLKDQIPESCWSMYEHGVEVGRQSNQIQFGEAYDNERKADLRTLSEAIYQFASANNGQLPEGITSSPQVIGSGEGRLNLIEAISPYLSVENSEEPFPLDPVTGTLENTGYSIFLNPQGRIVLQAQSSQFPNQPIEVVR